MNSSSSRRTGMSIVFFLVVVLSPTVSSHVINFRSPYLIPRGLAWEPTSQHFVISSLRHHSLKAVSDDGIVDTLISDRSLPPMVTILGVTIDSVNNRLLAIIHAFEPLPPFNALAAYDLTSGNRLFLTPLTNTKIAGRRQIATGVAVDHAGNAYVTNSAGNFIWKVEAAGKPSVFSKSAIFSSQHVYTRKPYSSSGLRGIAYVNEGCLLVVQMNTGKLFKVNADDGSARLVRLTEDLTAASGIAVRNDGVVVVMSKKKAWFLKSENGWEEAVIYDEVTLDADDKHPISVAVREENRTYVLYERVSEGSLRSMRRTEFSIEEITDSGNGKKDESADVRDQLSSS